jgi:hypothetical protein
LPRRDADEALKVTGELALVREAGVRGDLRRGQAGPCLEELLGPFDAVQDHVLVRRQPGGRLTLSGDVVVAEAGGRGQPLRGQVCVEVLRDVLDDGTEPPARQRAVAPARGWAWRQDVPE